MADGYDFLAFQDGINVVVLRAAGGRTVPVDGRTPIDLDNAAEPVGELLTELLAATVGIGGDEGIPPGVLEALRGLPVPAAFRASPWLSASRAIVVRDGVGAAGGLSVRYSDGGGLQIDLPETDRDADFDSDSYFDGDEDG